MDPIYQSPAIKSQSKYYPKEWHGRVPKIVRVTKLVMPDFPFLLSLPKRVICLPGNEYPVYVNSHGAISAIIYLDDESPEKLGLRPDEFEIIEWHGIGVQ